MTVSLPLVQTLAAMGAPQGCVSVTSCTEIPYVSILPLIAYASQVSTTSLPETYR